MQARKEAADETGEATVVSGWGGRRSSNQQEPTDNQVGIRRHGLAKLVPVIDPFHVTT